MEFTTLGGGLGGCCQMAESIPVLRSGLHGSIGQSSPLLIASCWWYALRDVLVLFFYPGRRRHMCFAVSSTDFYLKSMKPSNDRAPIYIPDFIQHWIHMMAISSAFFFFRSLPLATSGQVITSRAARPYVDEALRLLSTSIDQIHHEITAFSNGSTFKYQQQVVGLWNLNLFSFVFK